MLKASEKKKKTTTQAPFQLCTPTLQMSEFICKFSKALQSEYKVKGTQIYPNICDLSYGSGVELDGEIPSCTRTGSAPIKLVIERGFKVLTNWVISQNIEFMGGLCFPNWSLEVEIDYYPHREHATEAKHFGMHRDDYVRPGDSSEKGGVVFVALVFLNEKPILGPELFVDLGPAFMSPALTVPQLSALPPSFCRRVLEAKERELEQRLDDKVFIACPIIPPFSTVCFCEPLVIHQSPVAVLTPRSFEYHSDHASMSELWPPDKPGWFTAPKTSKRSADFAVNLRGKTKNLCSITRQQDEYFDNPMTPYDIENTYQDVIDNTFGKPRSLIRLTFRTIKGPPNTI